MEHTYLGTAFSDQAHWLTLDERLRHIAVNGKTGYGKSTLLKSVLAQDIARGDGVLSARSRRHTRGGSTRAHSPNTQQPGLLFQHRRPQFPHRLQHLCRRSAGASVDLG